jgi:hypothetical protein
VDEGGRKVLVNIMLGKRREVKKIKQVTKQIERR